MASATSAALAPGQLALTLMTGGVICGYCSTGISFQQLRRQRSGSAITIAKRGRRIKNVSIASPLFTQQLNGRAVTQALGAFRHYALPRFQAIGHHEALAMLTGGRYTAHRHGVIRRQYPVVKALRILL